MPQKYTWPGSNWRPSACEADVIATRPQVLPNTGDPALPMIGLKLIEAPRSNKRKQLTANSICRADIYRISRSYCEAIQLALMLMGTTLRGNSFQTLFASMSSGRRQTPERRGSDLVRMASACKPRCCACQPFAQEVPDSRMGCATPGFSASRRQSLCNGSPVRSSTKPGRKRLRSGTPPLILPAAWCGQKSSSGRGGPNPSLANASPNYVATSPSQDARAFHFRAQIVFRAGV